MCFDIAGIGGIDLCLSINRADELFLGSTVGHGDASGSTILVHTGVPNNRSNRITGVNRVLQRLQYYASNTFASTVSVHRL
jgi:hypothetical protein